MQKVKTRVLSVFMALTLALTMLVGLPISAKAAIGDYNAGDIAVIENIIDNNGLGWPKATAQAPASVDDAWMNTNWPGVKWSTDATNKRIEDLEVYSSGLTGALNVTGLDALVYLDCGNNIGLTSLDASGLTNMLWLDCYDCSISTLNVSGCTGLRDLWCWNNSLSALNLTGLTSLSHLVCSYNNLTDLDLSGNTALVILECGENSLETLTLTGLASLEIMYCDRNNLTALNLSDNIALVELYCGGNSLTALDVSTLVDLEYLWCNYNYLSTLNVSNNTALVELSCQNNGLGVLDLTGLANLEYLDCYENSLSTLTLTGLSNLEYLNCNNNNLSTLTLTGLTNLEYLYCGDNILTALDVSGCISLVELNCFDNKLTTLDVSNNTLLEELYCSWNYLTSLDVTGLFKLNILICENNFMSDPSMVTGVTTTNLPAIDTNIGGVFAFTPQRVYVCEIDGGAKYETIDDALADVVDGDTILLLVDVTLSATLNIMNGVAFTFDTNGFELDFVGNTMAIGNGSKVNFVGCEKFVHLAYADVYDYGTRAEFDSGLVLGDYFGAWDMAELVINGDLIVAGDAIYAGDGAMVTINGDIYSDQDGVVVFSGAIVTVNGNIYADEVGVYASGEEINITVVGSIFAGAVGIYVEGIYTEGPKERSSDIEITVTGDITVGDEELSWTDVFGTGIFAMECDGLTINVGGDIDAFYAGAFVGPCYNALINITGDITAGYLGAAALFDVQIFIGGNIVVTSLVPYEDDDTLVGAASGFGGQITIDGTITAVNYVALYFELYWDEDANEGDGGWGMLSVYVNANENKTPTSKAGYLEYNDSDADAAQWDTSFVWVKAATTPGTGDSATLWLLIGALMVAALGTGLVLAHRRREQQEI